MLVYCLFTFLDAIFSSSGDQFFKREHRTMFVEKIINMLFQSDITRGRRDRDRMIVGFTTTYAISACHQ